MIQIGSQWHRSTSGLGRFNARTQRYIAEAGGSRVSWFQHTHCSLPILIGLPYLQHLIKEQDFPYHMMPQHGFADGFPPTTCTSGWELVYFLMGFQGWVLQLGVRMTGQGFLMMKPTAAYTQDPPHMSSSINGQSPKPRISYLCQWANCTRPSGIVGIPVNSASMAQLAREHAAHEHCHRELQTMIKATLHSLQTRRYLNPGSPHLRKCIEHTRRHAYVQSPYAPIAFTVCAPLLFDARAQVLICAVAASGPFVTYMCANLMQAGGCPSLVACLLIDPMYYMLQPLQRTKFG